MADCAALEEQFNTELLNERYKSEQLSQALVETRSVLAAAQAHWTWRAGASLRKLASILSINKTRSLPSKVLDIDDPYQLPMPTANEQVPVTPLFTLCEPPMSIPPQFICTTPMKKASTLSELLAHDGKDFIQCSYITLLEREPDSEGMVYYLNRLKIGISKMEIITQLCFSSEGKNKEIDLPELVKSLSRYKRTQIPLIGWIFRRSEQDHNTRAALEAIRTLKKQIVTLDEQHQKHLLLIEQSIFALHTQLKQKQTEAVSESRDRTSIFEPVDTTGDEKKSAQAGFHRAIPNEKEIYFQLKSAILSNVSNKGNK